MTEQEIKTLVMNTLTSVAPEIEVDELEEDEDFRDQFDFDSMDFLKFATVLSEKTRLDIPEKDYPKLSSLENCLRYLGEKLPA